MANRKRYARPQFRRARSLRDEDGSFGTPIAGFIAVLIFLLVLGLGSNFPRLVATQTALASLAEGAAKDAAIQGCLTTQDLQGVSGKISALGWDPSQVSMNTSFGTTATNYDTPMTVTMGYNLPMLVFGQKVTWTWHLAAQGGPVLSQFIQPATATSGSAGCTSSSYSGPTYGQGAMDIALANPPITSSTNGSTSGDGSTGPSSSGAASLTASASPASVAVDQAVTVSGTAEFGGSPQPGTEVTLTPSGGGASPVTAVTDASGDYQAILVFDQVGTWTIAASDGPASAQAQVTVVPSAPAAVTVTANSPVTDGSQEIVYAEVTDQNGNPVADGTQVQVASSDSADIPSQTLATTNGEVALSVTWTQVGTWGVTFSAGSVSGIGQVVVQAGQAAGITVAVSPNPATANPNPLMFTDGAPNMVADPTFGSGLSDAQGFWNPYCPGGSVTTGSDPSAPSGTAATVNAPCVGLWQHLNGLSTTGYYVLSAWMDIPTGKSVQMDLEWGSGHGSYDYSPSPTYNPSGSEISVNGTGSWTRYHMWFRYVSGGNANFHLYANSAFTFQIDDVQVVPAFVVSGTVTDAQGNPVAQGTAVTVSSSTDSADFPTRTVVTDSKGRFWTVGNFSVAGTQSVTAAVAGVSASASVAITPGPAAQFVGVSLAPNPVDSGSELAASGTLEDAYGNPVANATVTMSGAGAADGTATTSSNGTFAVNITPKTTGSQTITLASGGATWSGTVTVQAASGDSVAAWVGSPGTTQATVTAGNSLVIGATVTSGGVAVSGATVTFTQPFDSGTASQTCSTGSTGECSVSITFTQAGTDVVQAAAGDGDGLVQITVDAGAPYAIDAYSVSPSSLTAGQSITASGTVVDKYGNPVGNSTVTLTTGSVQTTARTGSNGGFSGDQTLTKAGSFSVDASDGSAAASAPVTVSPGSASGLTVSANPSSGAPTPSWTTTVSGTVTDSYGNPVASGSVGITDGCGTSASASVSGTGTYSASLVINCLGSVTVQASDGNASGSTVVTSAYEPTMITLSGSPTGSSGAPIVAGTNVGFTACVYDNSTAYPVSGTNVTIGGSGVSMSGSTSSNGCYGNTATVTTAGMPTPVIADATQGTPEPSATLDLWVKAGAPYSISQTTYWTYSNSWYYPVTSGYVYDQYGNPVAAWTEVQVVGSNSTGGVDSEDLSTGTTSGYPSNYFSAESFYQNEYPPSGTFTFSANWMSGGTNGYEASCSETGYSTCSASSSGP